ncbi:hypothetical protein [Streptomyces sp. NRRL F-525]|uniref:hypothetical protein n=1 Tax=Streptomyces sp. NRRL F-525 TaxID=1463861 RepID=UPI0005261CAA|nr:hypothetical protein [Streptomyces sp. NRRL F-525]
MTSSGSTWAKCLALLTHPPVITYGARTPPGAKLASIGMRIRGGVTMTSLAQLAAQQGRSVPSEAEVRDAVAKALGAA